MNCTYELHKNDCHILPWCWYAVYNNYKPHLSEFSNLEVVKRGGVYVAGFAEKEKAMNYGVKQGWVAI